MVYPTDVTRPGHTFRGWDNQPSTMPAANIAISAIFSQVMFDVVWTGDDTVVYTATDQAQAITANFTEGSNTYGAAISISNADGAAVSEAVRVGVYTLTATPADPTNYVFNPATATFTLVIERAPVTVSGVQATLVKTYDGTNNAAVTDSGSFSGAPLGQDDVTVLVSAAYNNPDTGSNKPVFAIYTLYGADKDNYTLAEPSATISLEGRIIAAIALDADSADNGIEVAASGYCAGDNTGIRYFVESGTPTDYKLTYSAAALAQGFANVDWTAISTPGSIDLVIPADAEGGIYTADLMFRNELGDSTAARTINFAVNLSKNYVRPLFADVMAVVDTCHCLSGIQWYRDGVAVSGATGYYFQEPDGSTAGHTYYVHATVATGSGSSVTGFTCEQSDTVGYVQEEAPATVTLYPNPTADVATIEVQNAASDVHTLRVMNVMGVTLINTTFEGSTTTIDLGHMVQGSYTVSVDGTVVRVIKR